MMHPAPGMLAASLLALVLASIPARAEVDLVLSSPTLTAEVGDEFTIDVVAVTGSQQVDLVEFHLDFDPALIEVRAATNAAAVLPVPLVPITFDNAAGTIDYAYGTFFNFPSGTFTVSEITVAAIAPGDASFTFNSVFPRRTIATFAGADVLGTASGLTIDIRSDVEPFDPDVNADGAIDAFDAAVFYDVMYRVVFLFEDPGGFDADINRDGSVFVNDYFAGLGLYTAL